MENEHSFASPFLPRLSRDPLFEINVDDFCEEALNRSLGAISFHENFCDAKSYNEDYYSSADDNNALIAGCSDDDENVNGPGLRMADHTIILLDETVEADVLRRSDDAEISMRAEPHVEKATCASSGVDGSAAQRLADRTIMLLDETEVLRRSDDAKNSAESHHENASFVSKNGGDNFDVNAAFCDEYVPYFCSDNLFDDYFPTAMDSFSMESSGRDEQLAGSSTIMHHCVSEGMSEEESAKTESHHENATCASSGVDGSAAERLADRTIILLDETVDAEVLRRSDDAENSKRTESHHENTSFVSKNGGDNFDVNAAFCDEYVPYFCSDNLFDDYFPTAMDSFSMESSGSEQIASTSHDHHERSNEFALPSSRVEIDERLEQNNTPRNPTAKNAAQKTVVDDSNCVESWLRMPGRFNLADLLTPVRPSKRTAKSLSIEDEFFGVYCLISRSENKAYKNRCYIGYTVNPNRRIRQHNAGRQFGGAKKTDSRGPWDMVCIIHGFPNSISALRFEWAWQNPAKSRRLRDFESLQRKQRKETPFQHQLRIACRMLNSDPWRRLALTFRWLLPEFSVPFPADAQPPAHMKLARGVVKKANTLVPLQINEYTLIRACDLCGKRIPEIKRLLRCLSPTGCEAHFHARCLAESALAAQNQLHAQLWPREARCPRCAHRALWGDLVRDQRMLVALNAAKPQMDGAKIANGMIPLKICKK